MTDYGKTCENCDGDSELDLTIDTWFGPNGEEVTLCWGCAAKLDLEKEGSGWKSNSIDNANQKFLLKNF
jgi:hypothetical protein